MNQDFIQKLMVSKAIMDKHNEIPRSQNQSIPKINVESFETPNAKYNLPPDLLSEQPSISPKRIASTSTDAIKNSKLPDAIKKLMLENPIQQQKIEPTISNELIEKASRLMKNNTTAKINESPQPRQTDSDIRSIVKEAVKETLKEYGLISESSEKSNEVFSFKVGKHLFEGKITKIKKLS